MNRWELHAPLLAVLLGAAVESAYDYVFSENGLVAYKGGKLLAAKSMHELLGEEKLQWLLNYILHYIAGQPQRLLHGVRGSTHRNQCRHPKL